MAVNKVGPQKAACKIHNSLYMLPVPLHIGTDQSFLEGHATFLRFAVNGIDALLVKLPVRLYHDEHVRPLRVNDGLVGRKQGTGENGE